MFFKNLNVTFGIFALRFGVNAHSVMSITSSAKNLVTVGLVVVCRSLIILVFAYIILLHYFHLLSDDDFKSPIR